MVETAVGGQTVAAYGSWRSPISLDLVYAGRVSPAEPWFDGDTVYWLEGRPAEGGREALVRRRHDGTIEDVLPGSVNVRTMAQEYGGAAWAVAAGTLVYSDVADGRLYRLVEGAAPEPLTPPGPFRYADLSLDPARGRLICVREDHSAPGEAVTTLVAVSLAPGAAPAPPSVFVEGADFFAAPRLSPDGRWLAWLSWRHPNMPWDGTELWLGELDESGTLRGSRRVAGDPSLWVAQPRWSPAGVLYCLAEPTGWLNLHRVTEGGLEAVFPLASEFASADWTLGRATFGFTPEGRIVAAARTEMGDRLWLIDPDTGSGDVIDQPFSELDGVVVAGERALFVGGAPADTGGLVELELTTGHWHYVRRVTEAVVAPDEISLPRPITFPTSDGGVAHAFFYPPHNPRYTAPAGELPPLLVTSHGGPTASAPTSMRLAFQYLTSRGIAIVDVDYRGSTGYGRAYRQALEGAWGIYDVDDCVAAARYLARLGLVDGERLAIRGGSASGYTTLCALTFRDDFRAGVSYFGIGDLETFARDTHKFESRYLERLVGRYPEERQRYVERSPVNFPDRLSCPLLILQGLDDRVVPPNQAEEMVAVLRAKGLPHAYLPFEGEGHGFRRLETMRRAMEAELAFYGEIFGFTPADELPPLPLTVRAAG
ncbi:MAG: prolyl oligopeptidase family serine peptidase [Candidatus Limnocylindrales bacterium]